MNYEHRKQQEYLDEIEPFLDLKSKYLNMYSQINYYPTTGESHYEYSIEVQGIINKIDETITNIRERFFPNIMENNLEYFEKASLEEIKKAFQEVLDEDILYKLKKFKMEENMPVENGDMILEEDGELYTYHKDGTRTNID